MFNADDLHDLSGRLSGSHGEFPTSNLVNYGRTAIVKPGARTLTGVLLSGEAVADLLGEDFEVFPVTLTYATHIPSEGLDRVPVELAELESMVDRLGDDDEAFGAKEQNLRGQYERILARYRRLAVKAGGGKNSGKRKAEMLLKRLGRIYKKMQDKAVDTHGLATPTQIASQVRGMLAESASAGRRAGVMPDVATAYDLHTVPPAFSIEQREADRDLSQDVRAETQGFLFGSVEHDYFGVEEDVLPSEYESLMAETERVKGAVEDVDELDEEAFGAGGDAIRARYARLANHYRRFASKAYRKGTPRVRAKAERLLSRIRKIYMKMQEKGLELEGLTTPEELADQASKFVMEAEVTSRATPVAGKRAGKRSTDDSEDLEDTENEDEPSMGLFGYEGTPYDFVDAQEEIVFGLQQVMDEVRDMLGLHDEGLFGADDHELLHGDDDDLMGDDDDLMGDDEDELGDDDSDILGEAEADELAAIDDMMGEDDDIGDDDDDLMGDDEDEDEDDTSKADVKEAKRGEALAKAEARAAKAEARKTKAELAAARAQKKLDRMGEEEDEDAVEDEMEPPEKAKSPKKAKSSKKAKPSESSEEDSEAEKDPDLLAAQRGKLSRAIKQASSSLAQAPELVSSASEVLDQAKGLLSKLNFKARRGARNGGVDYGRLLPVPRGGASEGITVTAIRRRVTNPDASAVQTYAASFGLASDGHLLDVFAADFLDRSEGYDPLESMAAIRAYTGPNDYLYGDDDAEESTLMGSLAFDVRGQDLRNKMPAMKPDRLLQIASNPKRSRRSRRAAVQQLRQNHEARMGAEEALAEEVGYLFVTHGKSLLEHLPSLTDHSEYDLFLNANDRVRSGAILGLADDYADENFGAGQCPRFRVRGQQAVALIPSASSEKLMRVANNPCRSNMVRSAAAAELAKRHAQRQGLPAPVAVSLSPAGAQPVLQPTYITAATAPVTASFAPAYVPAANPAFAQPPPPQVSPGYFQDQAALEREVASRGVSYYGEDGSLNAYPFGDATPLPPPRRLGPEVFA